MGLSRINLGAFFKAHGITTSGFYNANNYLASDKTNELICFEGVSFSGKYGTLSAGIGTRETLRFGQLEPDKYRATVEPAVELKYTTPSLKLSDQLSGNIQLRSRGIGETWQNRVTLTSNFKINENNSIYAQGCITAKYANDALNTTFGGGIGYTHTFDNGIKWTIPEFWVNTSTMPALSTSNAKINKPVYMVNSMLTIPIKPTK